MWVAACLFVGLEDTYQLLRGGLTDELAEQFYRSAGFLAPVIRETLQVESTRGQQRRFEYLFLLVAFANRFCPGSSVRAAATCCWPTCEGESASAAI